MAQGELERVLELELSRWGKRKSKTTSRQHLRIQRGMRVQQDPLRKELFSYFPELIKALRLSFSLCEMEFKA